jgi:hypothetical protein
MPEKKDLDFKLPPRFEQVGDENATQGGRKRPSRLMMP